MKVMASYFRTARHSSEQALRNPTSKVYGRTGALTVKAKSAPLLFDSTWLKPYQTELSS